MIVCGMKISGHDTGVAIIKENGSAFQIAAISEERISREKHTAKFPGLALNRALNELCITIDDVDLFVTNHRRGVFDIATYFKYNSLEEHRLYDSYMGKILQNHKRNVILANHHDIHASSAFYASPFDTATVLVIDASGNCGETQSIYAGNKNDLFLLERSYRPGVGRIYEAVTEQILNLKGTGSAGKTMGLSAYGKGRNLSAIQEHISGERNGINIVYNKMGCNMDYFKLNFQYEKAENAEDLKNPYFMAVAYEVQSEVEQQLLYLANLAYKLNPSENLCIAGGVGLNCVANELLYKYSPFRNIWIQPAADDSGLPLGAALWGYNHILRGKIKYDMQHAFLGNTYYDHNVEEALEEVGVSYRKIKYSEIATYIANGQIIGWYTGRAEYGPRALGHRSILADPRNGNIKDIINSRIKHREWYRPYAPVVLSEKANLYFDINHDSKYMLFATDVRDDKREYIPGVTHVDGTARVQTLSKQDNEQLYELIVEFERITGIPMLLNTSFNDNKEPIVDSPVDALICAAKTNLDGLYLQGYYVDKSELERIDWLHAERTRTVRIKEEKKEVLKKYAKL